MASTERSTSASVVRQLQTEMRMQRRARQSSVRLGLRFFLPARLAASYRKVQLTIRGPNTTNVRFNGLVPVKTPKFGQGTRRFIFVPMRARNCGAYTLVVRRGGTSRRRALDRHRPLRPAASADRLGGRVPKHLRTNGKGSTRAWKRLRAAILQGTGTGAATAAGWQPRLTTSAR